MARRAVQGDKFDTKAECGRKTGVHVDMTDKVRLSLQMSTEMNLVLEELALDSGVSRSDVFRQALALAKVAHDPLCQ